MPRDKPLPNVMRLASIGMEFGILFTIFVLGGAWLDGKVRLSFPVCTLAGAALGFVLGMVRLVRQARQYMKKDAGSGKRPGGT